MELSIIITSYRNPQLLKVCLDSIREHAADIEHETIVADGQTQEDTEMMMREEFPEVRFFPFEKNVGFQALLEKGIAASQGAYMLILNGDIILTAGSIQKLLGHMQATPKIGIIGPKLLNFNGTLQYSCFRFYHPQTILYRRTFLGRLPFAKKHLDWFLMKDFDHESPRDVDWLMGSALLVSRAAFKEVGYMDKRFFMYMEDVDWCRRFWEKGYRVVYCPLARMHHYHGKTSGRVGIVRSLISNKYTWIHIFSGLKYFKKYWGKKTPHVA